MNLSDLMLWLAPVIVVSGGICLSHVKKMKLLRYIIYGAVFFTAFLIDLNSLKFSDYRLDIALFLSVTLVFSEIFWNLIRSANKTVAMLSLFAAILLFAFVYKQWAILGPAKVRTLWESPVVSEFTRGADGYKIRESVSGQRINARTLKLYKCMRHTPLEKFKGKFRVPEGYYNAQFRFRWYVKKGVINVELIGDSDILWTLHDGNLE